MKHDALMHEANDAVAVVIRDVVKGETVQIATQSGEMRKPVTAQDDIPLGHKIAVSQTDEGADVIKYGRGIGRATERIAPGAHVHTQNVVSKRWSKWS